MFPDDVRVDEFSCACVAPTEFPAGFEKVVDFDNVGLIIYRLLRKSINVGRDKRGKTADDCKTVIVHNTSDTNITSEDFLPEIQKRKITCQRCRQVIELALKLLQKVPAINKKAIMGICDHCKLKDPCCDCKETTKSFLNKYEARGKNQQRLTGFLNIWENEPEDSAVTTADKQPKISESVLRIQEFLRQDSVKAERELDISDLCSHMARFSKSEPAIGKDNKHLFFDESFMKKPSSDSKLVLQIDGKISFAPENIQGSDNRIKKTTYTPSKQRLKDLASALQHSKEFIDTNSIITDDNILIEPGPVLQVQKQKHYEDEDIFPKHPKSYAHEREKGHKDYEQKYIDDLDDQYFSTAKKKFIVDKKIDDSYLGTTEKKYDDEKSEKIILDETEIEDIASNLKKGIEKPDLKPKSYELETAQKDFSFSFLIEKKKSEVELERHKPSFELIKELQDLLHGKSEDIKIKVFEKRLQREEEKERKRLKTEEKSKIFDEKASNIEKGGIILEKMKLMKKKQRVLIKNKVTAKHLEHKEKKVADKHLEHKEKKVADKYKKPKIQDTEKILVGTSDLDQETPPHTPISQYDSNGSKSDSVKLHTKDKAPLKEEIEKSIIKQQREKEKALVKQEKKLPEKKTLSKQEKKPPEEKSLLKEGKEKRSKKLKGEKDLWKMKKDSDKKEKPMIFKLGGDNKDTQTQKKTQGFGLDDILKGKKVFKSKDTTQLARMQNLPEKKTGTTSTDKKLQKKKDIKSLDKKGKKIRVASSKEAGVVVTFKGGSGGLRYQYHGKTLREHWDLHEKCHKNFKDPSCPFCLNSDLELNVALRKPKFTQTELIKGQKIVNLNQMHDTSDKQRKPMLFQTNYNIPIIDIEDNKKLEAQHVKPKTVDKGTSTASGVTCYALSDRTFIDKGWTVLPTEKVMRKMNVYRMRPAKPEFDWFKRNKDKQQIFYDSGERFSKHDENGRCRWYYKNQRLALDHYDAEEPNAQQRFVIYSNGEPDDRGRPRPYAVLAMFDHLGNGVVFDHGGKIRMKYNQTEGVVLDKSIGPASHWQWHTLNDPPELQQVMIDTQMAHKDPKILAMGDRYEEKTIRRRAVLNNEEMLAIEFDNVVKEKSKKLRQNFKPFQIRMKAMQINEHFSLKVLDQANVYLIYRDGTTNIKLNIGMLLDHKEIVDTDTIEVGEVANNIERLPAQTDSLAAMQKSVAHAQRFERTRMEREHKFRPPSPSASADKLTAAVGRPLRPPLRAIYPSNASTMTRSTPSISGKPSSSNVYYCQM